MKRFSKIAFVLVATALIVAVALADRGVFVRKKHKVQLNISTINTLKGSVAFNLKSGLTFKGSTFLNSRQIGNNIFNTALLSYKKGNTIYILPYRQKILIPSYTQSEGYKLIIRNK